MHILMTNGLTVPPPVQRRRLHLPQGKRHRYAVHDMGAESTTLHMVSPRDRTQSEQANRFLEDGHCMHAARCSFILVPLW